MARRRPSGLNATLQSGPRWPLKIVSSLPVAAFQMRAAPSADAVATSPPLGAKMAAQTASGWRNSMSRPVSGSQTRALLSFQIVMICRPFGPNCAPSAQLWPVDRASSRPDLALHSRTVLSVDAVITRLPSSLKATLRTDCRWPSSCATTTPLCTSHTRAVASSEAVAARRPSGLNTAPNTAPS